jgi:uncharacterized protein
LVTLGVDVVDPRIRSGWLRVLLFLIVTLVLASLLSVMAIGMWVVVQGKAGEAFRFIQGGGGGGDLQSLGVSGFVAMQLPAFVATLINIILFRRFVDRRSVGSLGLTVVNQAQPVLMGIMLGAALITAGFGTLYLWGMLRITSLNFVLWPIISYAGVFFFGAFMEEFLVRGYILKNLMDATNSYVALFASSLIFALLHLMNPHMAAIPLMNLVLAGVLLGIYPMHRKNLWFSVALHWSWNFFQGPIFGLQVSGIVLPSLLSVEVVGPSWLSGGKFGFEGSVVATVVTLVASIGIDWRCRKSVDGPSPL